MCKWHCSKLSLSGALTWRPDLVTAAGASSSSSTPVVLESTEELSSDSWSLSSTPARIDSSSSAGCS